ncbi:MAG TPA: ribonuclease P protein component [Myxococcales bacterium]|nr:ribonuclease P protein component [Myxococcales bacterium]HBU47126.1 ribonuclease P protein component [Myxococcales bacterium]
MTETFPKAHRLRFRRQFLRVQRRGRRFDGQHMFLFVARDRAKGRRFGFTVSKKVGKAVTRNQVRRRLREVVRMHRSLFPMGFHYVIVARPKAAKTTFQLLKQDLLQIAQRVSS